MNSRNNRILILGLVLLGLVVQPSLAKVDKALAVWAITVPAIDGNPDDWAGVSRGLNKSTQVEYAFRNDEENLYVLILFKDPKFLSSINTTGLTIYFNTEGNKEREHGVNFTQKEIGPDVLIAILEKQGQVLAEERKQELRSRKIYILFDSNVVDGKGNVLGPGVRGGGESLPPVFRVAQKDKETAYEFRIPLGKREDHPAGIGTAAGRKLMVELEWGGMTKEMQKARAAQVNEDGSQATQEGREFEISSEYEGDENMNEPQSSLSSMLRGPKRHSFRLDLTLASPGSN